MVHRFLTLSHSGGACGAVAYALAIPTREDRARWRKNSYKRRIAQARSAIDARAQGRDLARRCYLVMDDGFSTSHIVSKNRTWRWACGAAAVPRHFAR